MLYPSLVIAGRGFHDHSGIEAHVLHGRNRVLRQIIDHAQVMLALGPNEDVATLAILVAQPRHGFYDCLGIPHTRDHDPFACSGVWVVEPNLKQFGAHRRDLLLDHCGGLALCLI